MVLSKEGPMGPQASTAFFPGLSTSMPWQHGPFPTIKAIKDGLNDTRKMCLELQDTVCGSGFDLNSLWQKPFLRTLYNIQRQLGRNFKDIERVIWTPQRQAERSIGAIYKFLRFVGELGAITFVMDVDRINPEDREIVFECGMKLARDELAPNIFPLPCPSNREIRAFQAYTSSPIKHIATGFLKLFNSRLKRGIQSREILDNLRKLIDSSAFHAFLVYASDVPRKDVSTHAIQGGMRAANIYDHPLISDIRRFQQRILARALSLQSFVNDGRFQGVDELEESGLARGELIERYLDEELHPAYDKQSASDEMAPIGKELYSGILSRLSRVGHLSGVAVSFLDRDVKMRNTTNALGNVRSELIQLSDPSGIYESGAFEAALRSLQLQLNTLRFLVEEQPPSKIREEIGVRATLFEAIEIMEDAAVEIETPESAAG